MNSAAAVAPDSKTAPDSIDVDVTGRVTDSHVPGDLREHDFAGTIVDFD
jgi:hypothetical protein